MRRIILINFFLVGFWLIFFALSKINFPYFVYVWGILILFLPGLNLSLLFEQITAQRQGVAKIIFWSFLATCIITPKIIYSISSWQNNLGVESKTMIIFFAWWLLTFLLFVISYFIKHFEPTEFVWSKIKNHRIFWWAILIWALFLVGNFLLYRFMPGADTYKYVLRIETGMQTHLINETSRALFYVFSWMLFFLSRIPIYFIYKAILPSLSIIFILLFYQYAKQISQNKFVLLFSTLGIVTFPIIIMELLMSRPQLIFLLTFPIVLFLATDLLKNRKPQNLLWSLYLLTIVFVGIRVHQFFIILSAIVLIGFLVFYWPVIKKYPWPSILIIILLGYYFYSLLIKFNLIKFINPFLNAILHPQFKLWFINNYTNIDGYQMGWPGYTFIYYYGYNIGIALVALLILIVVKKVKIALDFRNTWLYFLSFFIFFSIAEIFPRLGLNYLPDRAWLLASLSLLFFLPLLLEKFINNFNFKFTLPFLIGLLIISVAVSWYITYAKQGRITENEFKVSQYIQDNLPQDAAIISQSSNGVMIRHFAKRIIVVPPTRDFFNDKWSGKELLFINDLPDYLSKESYYLKQKKNLEQIIKEIENKIVNAKTYGEINDLTKKLVRSAQKLRKINQSLAEIKEKNLKRIRPVYILYSKDQFSTMSGQRSWWKDKNFYNANLDKFNEHPEYFRKIYDQDGIYVWEVRL